MQRDPVTSPRGTPLTGRRIVVTRPRQQSRELCDRLREFGARVIAFPTIKIVPAADIGPLQAALQHMAEYDWMLFTSRNAVDVVVGLLPGDPAAALSAVRIVVVGEATRGRLREFGMEADFVPSDYNMASLCAELIQSEDITHRRFLYPCSDLADFDGQQPLRDAGATVDAVAAYRTVPDDSADADALQRQLSNREIDAVIFASPSAARSFFVRFNSRDLSEYVAVVSIGPKTTRVLRELTEGRVLQAERADSEAIVDAVIRAVA